MPCSVLYASWMRPPPRGLLHGAAHRVGHGVRIEEDSAAQVARGAAGGLDEGGLAPEEPFLVGVEDRDHGDLGKVEPLAQEVDADQTVEDAAPEVREDRDAVERLDVRVQVAAPHADLREVVGQLLGHALGQRRHEDALAAAGGLADDRQQVVDLALDRPDLDDRVEQAGRADDLLHDLAAGALELLGGRRGAHGDDLPDALAELVVGQRAVVQRGGQAEAVVDQDLLARPVAEAHPPHLGQGHVRLVDDEQEVVRKVVEERRRRLPRRASGEVARVVLDAVAVAELLDHLQVEHRALVEPLGLEQAAGRVSSARRASSSRRIVPIARSSVSRGVA